MEELNNGSINSDAISLKEFILNLQKWYKFLLSKWIVIIIAGVIGGGIGLVYAYLSKPIYKAQLSFALQDEKPSGLSGALGVASQFGIDLNGGAVGGEFSGDNLLELMKSRFIVEKTLLTPIVIKGKKETLAEYYIDFNRIREAWGNNPELKGINFLPDGDRSKFTLKQDSVLGVFHKALITTGFSVDKVDKKLSILSITVVSTDEFFSKTFAEVLEKVVSDFYIETKTEKLVKNVTILQRQTDSVRRLLNGAISGVATSIDSAPNPNPLLQTLHVPSQRKQVDVQTNGAILNELVKNLEVAKMSLLQATPLIQVIDRPIFPLEKTKPGRLKGLLLGGFIAVFLTIVALILKRVFQIVMS